MTNLPTEPRAVCRLPTWEYMQRKSGIDRNFSVAEFGPNSVVLRLDFPGPGLADFSAEFFRQWPYDLFAIAQNHVSMHDGRPLI
jgi:hypothetical protein